MLKDCLEVFRETKGDDESIIIDSYILSDGDYIIVRKDGSLDHCFVKFDKKTKAIENQPLNYDEFCTYDYHSKLVDMNKPVDPKKIIHSNNYLSFSIKQENLYSGKLTNEIVNEYYNILKNPELKYKKPQEKTMYEDIKEKLGDPNFENIDRAKAWVEQNVLSINNDGIIFDNVSGEQIKLSGKNYLKVFFEADLDELIREDKRYLLMKLFNDNSYSEKLDENIVGLSNDNMGLNSKKPFLEHKNQKSSVPYLISSDEAYDQKVFFDYLMNQVNSGKYNMFIDTSHNEIFPQKNGELPESDFQGYFLNLKKGTEVAITNQEIITSYKNKLDKPLKYKDYINNDKLKDYFGTYTEKAKVQAILDEVMFFKFLINNYFTGEQDISIKGEIKTYLILSRNAIFQWIYNDNWPGMKRVVNLVFPKIVRDSINKGYMAKAIYQFSLYLSLKEYFNGGEDMEVDYIKIEKDLEEKINKREDCVINSDEEYYYAVGQLVNYYISLNKSKDKKHSLANPFFNAKNDEIIKERLRRFFMKYNYDISFNSVRFNSLYGMIMAYCPKGDVNQDAIIAGYLRSNLMYKSNKNKEVKEEM